MTVRTQPGVAPPLLDEGGIERLREALVAAGFTSDGIGARIGADPMAALHGCNGDAIGRATAGGDRLDTLIRLFGSGVPVGADAAARALHPLPLAVAGAAGLVREQPTGEIVASLDLHPYRQWWIVADREGAGPHRRDHVLCVSASSNRLVDATVGTEVSSALDIGIGGGVQALHLSTHAATVTGTDLSPRALRFAATTAALNQLQWELRAGDLTEPVASQRFDLVVSNLPYVAGPAITRFLYRDSGRDGDAVGARLAAAAPGLLTDGGWLQFAANWLHIRGQDWKQRVADWVPGSGMDAWVVELAVTAPEEYVRVWMADARDNDPACRREWLEWLATNQVDAIGSGLVTIRNSGHVDPVVRVEELPQQVAGPFGAQVPGWFDRQDWLRGQADPLEARYVPADGVVLHQEAVRPGGEDSQGWHLSRQRLVLRDALRWNVQVEPLVAAIMGICTNNRPIGEQIREFAAQDSLDVGESLAAARAFVPRLVERGFLIPAG